MGGSEMAAAGRVKVWEPVGGLWNWLERGGWRVERGVLDRSAQGGGPARLAGGGLGHFSLPGRGGLGRGGWRVERVVLDRSAQGGGPARLAGRVWAHFSWPGRVVQEVLA